MQALARVSSPGPGSHPARSDYHPALQMRYREIKGFVQDETVTK